MKQKTQLSIFALLTICLLAAFAEPAVIDENAIAGALQTEDAFAAVVELAKPAVVVITNKQVAPQRRQPTQQMPPDLFRFFGIPSPFFDEEPQEQPWQQPQRPRRNRPPRQRPQEVGKGSGVIIDSKGYILTNCHVIEGNAFLTVKTSDGTVYDNEKDPEAVKVIGMDEETDLAVIQIGGGEKDDFHYLQFADSDRIRVGQWAIAIGAPFNFDYSVTIGCVSQKGRYDTGMSTFENYIQTDASINPGNSGGPLLNIRGEIIGINQFIYTGGISRGSIGLGFAIASNLARQVSSGLIRDGEMSRPFIGVSMQELTDDLKAQFNVDYGVIVSEAIEGEGAAKAGIEAGDIIQKIGDQEVNTPHDLLIAVTGYHPGDTIPVTVIRDGKEKVFKVTAGRREEQTVAGNRRNRNDRRQKPDNEPDDADDILARLGLNLEFVDKQAFVKSIDPEGIIAQAEGRPLLIPGDRILQINRIEIKKKSDLEKAFKNGNGQTALFYVERIDNQNRKRRFFLPVVLDESSQED